jgi:hypothetical protein
VKPKSTLAAVASGAALVLALVGGPAVAVPSAAATPPPTPPPISAPSAPQADATLPPATSSTPIPIPSGYGLPGFATPRPGGSATPSPPPDARSGLQGVWEMQIQRADKTEYTHFNIAAQNGGTLTGSYLDSAGKHYPLAGSVDGQTIRLIVSMPDGKEKWIDNLNASPGGLGGSGSGGGGYTPPR